MPPLRERTFISRAPTEEELRKRTELTEKSYEIYGAMQSLAPFPRRYSFLINRNLKSEKARYPLPGHPNFRFMTAWVERNLHHHSHVMLKTQVIEEINGRVIDSGEERIRAATLEGGLADWDDDADRALTHEEQLRVLEDITDTLDLIAIANGNNTSSNGATHELSEGKQ